MSYYDSVLSSLPYSTFRLNDAGSAWVDLTGRGTSITGTVIKASSIIAENKNSMRVESAATKRVPVPIFKPGTENNPFSLGIWFMPGVNTAPFTLLAHYRPLFDYDGLIFDGDFVRFKIKSAGGTYTEANWPIPDVPEAYHVVAVYAVNKIQLYVNKELVSETELSEDFKSSGFATADFTDLFIGSSSQSGQSLVVDGISIFNHALTSNEVAKQFDEGRETISIDAAVGAFSGAYWDGTNRDIAMAMEFDGDEWAEGVSSNVSITSGDLVPASNIDTNLSVAGTWTVSIPVGALTSNIFGIKASYEGDGSFVVESSIDGGSTWSPLPNGRLVVGSYNLNPGIITNVLLRVTFAGGILFDTSVVRKLSATVYSNNKVIGNSDITRSLTLSDLISTNSMVNQPIERNLASGFDIYGDSSIVLGSDTSEVPKVIGSIEGWMRLENTISGAGAYFMDTRNGGGTAFVWMPVSNGMLSHGGLSALYVNGSAATSGTVPFKYGEWVHLIAVLSTPFNLTQTSFGVAGFDGQLGHIAIYPSQLTAAEAKTLYEAYSSVPKSVITDAGTITIAEPATPYNIYSYAWDISAGG